MTTCKPEYTEAIAQFQVDMAATYGIQSVPTFMLFRSGQQLWRQSGALPLADLKGIVSNFFRKKWAKGYISSIF